MQKYTLTLLIALKIAHFCCFSLRESRFLLFLPKKFYNINSCCSGKILWFWVQIPVLGIELEIAAMQLL